MTAMIKLFPVQDPRPAGHVLCWKCPNDHLLGVVNARAGGRIDGPVLSDPEDVESARVCRWCAEVFDPETTPDGMIYLADLTIAGGWSLEEPIMLDPGVRSSIEDGSGT